MRQLPFLFCILLTLFSLPLSAQDLTVKSCCAVTKTKAGRCTGDAYCNVCTNCSRCAYCNSGGSCGVCAGGRVYYQGAKKKKKKTYTYSNNTYNRSYNNSYNSSSNSSSTYGSSRSMEDEPFASYYKQKLEVKVDVLNFRSAPGTHYSLIGKLKRGAKLSCLAKSGDWAKVKESSTGRIGYVHLDYVFTDNKENANRYMSDDYYADYYKKTLEVKADILNLREGPGTNYAIIGSLRRGKKLICLARSGDWYKVQVKYEEKVGFVHKDYVSLLGY